MNKELRAKSFQKSLTKVAEAASAYFQRDPNTGKYRGIIEYQDASGQVSFKPEAPVVSKDLNKVKSYLQNLVQIPLTERGMSEPWHAESNMPFDEKGNRVD